ncbi:ricin-type beta-trefoil lectin domain protein [Paraburkholderia phytofirmans]|uniref:ricin-type beta-trefoil lectin domain protein n=1 Tax=Paraburkholderia phytofirmans TaxID=261302 RepID=UPI0038BA6D80
MPSFYIKSAMDTGYNLQVQNEEIESGSPIIFGEQSPTAWSSVWQITPDGVIACAANPAFVLTSGSAGGNNNKGFWLQLSPRTGDASQQWIIRKVPGYGSVSVYTIQNQQTSQYIDANCGPQNFQSGQPVLTWPNNAATINEYWVLDDLNVKPTAVYIQCESSGGLNTTNPFVLDLATLSGTSTNNIYNCVVNPWEQGKLSQAWHVNSDGTITNARTPLLAITATGHEAHVLVQPLQANTFNILQCWLYDDSSAEFAIAITDSDTELMNVQGGGSPSVGNQIITWIPSKAGSNDFWQFFEYAPTVPGQPVTLQVTSNQQVYALTMSANQSGAAVVLDTAQSGQGNLNQLWCLFPDGTVLSFANTNLALTFQEAGNQPVTVETYSAGNAQQQWWLQTNGALAARGTAKGMQYLDASSGYSNQAPLTTGSSAVEWSVSPYESAGHPGQWFTIRSGFGLPGSGAPLLLTVALGGKLMSSAPVGTMFGTEPRPAISQLWQLTLEGALVNAIDPSLVLTVSGNQLALAPNSSTPQQLWQWAYSGSQDVTARGQNVPVLWGTLQNMGTGNPVLTASGANGTGNTVSAAPLQGTEQGDSPGNYPAQLWYVAPHMPAFDQPTTLALVQPNATGSLVLALSNNTFAPGTAVVAVESSSAASTATWQFTDTGQIVNTANPVAVLSLTAGNPDPQTLSVYPLQPGNERFQTWTLTEEGLIYNMENMQALTVTIVSGTATLTTSPVVEDGGESGIYQRWDVSPSPALLTVLMQPPVPFPAAPAGSDEAAAYVYINAMLGLQPSVPNVVRDNALRLQYANLAAPLAAWQRQLSMLQRPTEIDAPAWSTVVAQLDAELTSAIGVQALFVQISMFHLMFSQAQAMALPGLITAVQLAETDKVTIRKKHAWIWDLCVGLVTTALNGVGAALGDPWVENQLKDVVKPWIKAAGKYGTPVLANLMQTSLTTTQAVMQSHQAEVQRDIDFEMTVLQLQQKLLETFQTMGQTLGEIQALVFRDWGKLRAVYEMTTLTNGGASLYWPSMLAPTLVDKLLPGYVNSVLQILMPNSAACQKIYRYSEQKPQTVTTTGLQSDLVSYIDLNPDGTQTTYTVGQSTPTQQMTNLMEMVWSNGVSPFQFFHAQAGWSQMQITEGSSDYTGKDNTFMVAYVQNFTGQPLYVWGYIDSTKSPEGQIWSPIDPVPLAPYGICTFAAATNGKVGNPVQGTIEIQDVSQNILASGPFHADGTSHNWNCSIVAKQGYSVTSSYEGAGQDDMINWNIGFYPA